MPNKKHVDTQYVEIKDKLDVVIMDVLGNATLGEIHNTSKIVEHLGADSLDVLEIIMGVEETFNIEISDEEAGKLNTVEDVIEHVVGKLG